MRLKYHQKQLSKNNNCDSQKTNKLRSLIPRKSYPADREILRDTGHALRRDRREWPKTTTVAQGRFSAEPAREGLLLAKLDPLLGGTFRGWQPRQFGTFLTPSTTFACRSRLLRAGADSAPRFETGQTRSSRCAGWERHWGRIRWSRSY